MKLKLLAAAACLAAATLAGTANAAIVRVSEANFQATAGLITFSEFSPGTTNPTYTPADYGGGAGSPTITTGGLFVGQSLSANPGVDCPGAAATACVVGSPTGPLTLDPNSPNVTIVYDGAFPSSPTLSGSPIFNGPIALLFDVDQFGVGFLGGYFDAIGSTGITAFARDGSLLGTVVNLTTGIEFLGLVSDTANIAGVFLDMVGSEPAGFNIDNLRFGQRGQIVVPQVPLPAGLPLLAGGLMLLSAVGLRRRR